MLIGSLPKDQKVDKNKGRLPYSEDGYHLSKVQYQDFVRGYTGHPFKFWIESKDKIYRSLRSDIKKKWTTRNDFLIKAPVQYCTKSVAIYFPEQVTKRWWYNRTSSAPVYGGVIGFNEGISDNQHPQLNTFYYCPIYFSTNPDDLTIEYVVTTQGRRSSTVKVESVTTLTATDYVEMSDGTKVYISTPILDEGTAGGLYPPLVMWAWGSLYATKYQSADDLPIPSTTSDELELIRDQTYGRRFLVNHTVESGVVKDYQEYTYAGGGSWNPGRIWKTPLPYQWREMQPENISGSLIFDPVQQDLPGTVGEHGVSLRAASMYGISKDKLLDYQEISPNLDLPFLISGYANVIDYPVTDYTPDYLPFLGNYTYVDFLNVDDSHIPPSGTNSFVYHIIISSGLMKLNFGHDVAAIDTGETSNYIFYGGEYYEDVSDDDFDPEVFPFKVSSDGYMYATQLIKLDATSEEDVTINRVSITPLTANTLKLATVKVDGESNDICMQRIQPLIIPQGIPIAKIKYNGQDEIILVAPLSGVSSVQSNEEV